MKFFEMDAGPYPHYMEMRAKTPVFLNPQSNIWEVYSYQECQEVLGDATAFSSEVFNAIGFPELQTLAMMDPPRHTKIRRLIAKAFTVKLLNQQTEQIQALANALIDRVIDQGEMDVVKDLAFPLPATVIAGMLGIPKEDHELFREWSAACLKVIVEAMGNKKPTPELLEAVKQMTDYLAGFAVERRKNPRDDLISALATATVDEESLSIEEICNTCKLLVNAGHDTTKLLIGNVSHILLQDSALKQRVIATPEVFDGLIEETIRYCPPSQFFARIALKDSVIGGHLIKAGQWVKVFLGSANRDEKAFPQANQFDVDRNPNRHLGFGYGIHYCMGAQLGRMETKISLNTMLERLPNLRINPEKPQVRSAAIAQFGFVNLPVLFDKPTA